MLRTAIAKAFVSYLIWTAHSIQADQSATQSSLDAYLAKHPIVTQSVDNAAPTLIASSIAAEYSNGNFSSGFRNPSRCPAKCSITGSNHTNWPVYSSLDRLTWCDEPMLVNFALFNPLNDTRTHTYLQVCSADYDSASTKSKRDSDQFCLTAGTNQTQASSSLQLAWSNVKGLGEVADVVTALQQLGNSLSDISPSCDETINFAYSGKAAVGIYLGSGLQGQGIGQSVLDQFISQVQSEGISENVLVQLCDDRSARYSMGVIANSNSDLASVQEAVQQWRNSTCITTFDNVAVWQNITFLAPANPVSSNSSNFESSVRRRTHKRNFLPRASTCTTVQVVSGDSCASLATECGITAAAFTTYNPSSTLCSSLAVGEYVCCSSGSLPDNSPKPTSNGYCFQYKIKSGDTCSQLAASNSITIAEIESYNSNTWGWMGCADLLISYYICLSTGYPPMPANVPSAQCGPQVNGTTAAPPGTDLSTMNSCPLNACCDIWGQCGTTAEFCTKSNSSTNAPGTAAPGTNGCISNCGTAIVIGDAPASYFKIGYFEAFDWQRPCLDGSIASFNTSSYSHIHLAFATINPDFSLNISSISSQFPLFLGISGAKRIISIGGWDFSTSPDTYMIFRNAVAEANRDTLVNNIVDFLVANGLDGVDIDWEYPGEPDIPGIPASTAEDASNFFLFLFKLQVGLALLAPGRTISVTAPASYWYLHNIPIDSINLVVDYIVFMTYDLHGTWDYGNAFSDPGCPGGNCLRSDVNLTETINALSMITKAGIPSNKVIVGVTSYGRSFQMDTAGCNTEMCTYTGGGAAGPCTGTKGYIGNGEINDIIATDSNIHQILDDSYTNILVYDDIQWVGYMDDANKAVRTLLYNIYNFGGTADWAIDLQSGGSSSPSSSTSSGQGFIDPIVWTENNPVVTGPPGWTLIWPPFPLSTTTTITFPLLTTDVTVSTLTTITTTFNNGLVTAIPSYILVTIPTVVTIPAVVTNSIAVWDVVLPTDHSSGPVYLTSSIQPSPFGVLVTPIFGGITSVYNPTTTATGNGTTVFWGDYTYISIPVTRTLGGSTTVIGGTTFPPTTITITPPPYPTSTASTTDKTLNSKSASWVSGSAVGPPCKTNCGSPCWLFCDSGCPFCPPGFGGLGGGGDNSKPTSTGTSTSSETSVETVGGYATDYSCSVITTFVAQADLSSLLAAESSIWDSFFPTSTVSSTSTVSRASTTTSVSAVNSGTTTTASTVSSASTTTIASATPTYTTSCAFWDNAFFYTFEILLDYTVTDSGSAVKTQEKGCGAVTGWTWVPATSTLPAYVKFNLPFTIRSGCVERALVSAGGPKISCKGMGLGEVWDFLPKRGEEVGELVPPSMIEEDYPIVYPYVPMNWSWVLRQPTSIAL